MSEIRSDLIVQIDQNTYSVPSSSGDKTYEVRADIGLCSGWKDYQGTFCKHQDVVHRAFGGPFPNNPQLTAADCRELGHLALGDRCPMEQFFKPFMQEDPTPLAPPATIEPVTDGHARSSSEPLDGTQQPLASHSSQQEVGYVDFTTALQHASINRNWLRMK
ncbi:hypothetical protein HPB50_011635 [Hyalomma asiaticum]|uniref:Uncharacterized protein n=1 Tax=Hyalomma asiaticum TaxID=266040 RepID=A0ACB7TMN5_HYAAI|nr:hypothetical protein HPB50_011635 [Hyalomma asiaticum]